MSLHESTAENLAQAFHRYYETLTRDSGSTLRPRGEFWENIPAEERDRLVAAIRQTLADAVAAGRNTDRERYFAKPGEAEWGC